VPRRPGSRVSAAWWPLPATQVAAPSSGPPRRSAITPLVDSVQCVLFSCSFTQGVLALLRQRGYVVPRATGVEIILSYLYSIYLFGRQRLCCRRVVVRGGATVAVVVRGGATVALSWAASAASGAGAGAAPPVLAPPRPRVGSGRLSRRQLSPHGDVSFNCGPARPPLEAL